MSAVTQSDFSLPALYAALDEQRQARGLSWAQVAREINRHEDRPGHSGISATTITGTRTRAVAEGDGVLQMLRWLNRTPESFMPGYSEIGAVSAELPGVPPNKVLRFDTKKLYSALNARRIEREMTWLQVAGEIGVATSTLTYLARGTRAGFPPVMRIVRWLDRAAADFTRLADH